MLGILISGKFSNKCKQSVKCIRCRLETIRKKKQTMVRYLKKDVADLISGGHDVNAFGRQGAARPLSLPSPAKQQPGRPIPALFRRWQGSSPAAPLPLFPGLKQPHPGRSSLSPGLERGSAWSEARPGARLGLERGSTWSEARPGARLGLERGSAWSGNRPQTRPHVAESTRSSSPAPAAKHATRVTMFQLGQVKPSVYIFARKPPSTNGWGEGSSPTG
ncbi:hypothetical protein KSP40_PGU005288 [Platanthera guangdongensis]|uniref:Uncharacterized protein n=1 Tax=Platanthera guangdongensis TaxID=2320717 RepID=A0ABR2MQD2_9ASPA